MYLCNLDVLNSAENISVRLLHPFGGLKVDLNADCIELGILSKWYQVLGLGFRSLVVKMVSRNMLLIERML